MLPVRPPAPPPSPRPCCRAAAKLAGKWSKSLGDVACPPAPRTGSRAWMPPPAPAPCQLGCSCTFSCVGVRVHADFMLACICICACIMQMKAHQDVCKIVSRQSRAFGRPAPSVLTTKSLRTLSTEAHSHPLSASSQHILQLCAGLLCICGIQRTKLHTHTHTHMQIT